MRIIDILHRSVRLQGNVANALVNFSTHTVSLVVVVSDQWRNGKPVVGLSFDGIGRFAQPGILAERMIPRLLQADADTLLDASGRLCPRKVLACAMQNEKPGGHGDRAHAAAALELAIWDLNSKLDDEPAAAAIARQHGRTLAPTLPVYAAGGYYYPGEDAGGLADEIRGHQARGFTRFKMKIGGAPPAQDMRRNGQALAVAGSGSSLAVDANGRFNFEQALDYGRHMSDFDLWWYEEPCDPLDFDAQARLAQAYRGPLATGENLFSHQDARNLALYGGLRPGWDIFQMDATLSYGVTGYGRMLAQMEQRGLSRAQAFPHGGQLMALHVAAGLGLGGCEVYPGVFAPLGGFADDMRIEEGQVRIPDEPGFGFERKSALMAEFAPLLNACNAL